MFGIAIFFCRPTPYWIMSAEGYLSAQMKTELNSITDVIWGAREANAAVADQRA
jgi:hypothetical protein